MWCCCLKILIALPDKFAARLHFIMLYKVGFFILGIKFFPEIDNDLI